MTTTFSSNGLRERDKVLEDKHRKEIEALERKLERLKRSLNDAGNQLSDLQNRGNRLANSLGFTDIGEAQRAIDTSDYELTYRQTFERIQELEDKVSKESKDKQQLQARCQELEDELVGYRGRSTTWEKDERRLQTELRDLQVQFDSLKDAKERAAERYKLERKKYYRFHNWLFYGALETAQAQSKHEQKLQRDLKKELLMSLGPEVMKIFGIEPSDIDEVLESSAASRDIHSHCASSSKVELDHQHVYIPPLPPTAFERNRVPPFDADVTPQSQSSNPLQIAGQDLPLTSIINGIKQEEFETPKTTKMHKVSFPFNSSDTEDDSQAPQNFKVPLPHPLLNTRNFGNSSDTEEDSQAPNLCSSPIPPPSTSPVSTAKPGGKRLMSHNLPARPSFHHTRDQSDIVPSGLKFDVKPEPVDADPHGMSIDSRPKKKARIDWASAFQTPQPTRPSSPQKRGFSTGQIIKEKRRYADENTPIPKNTPLTRTSGQTRLEDYSIYKGRGRYRKEVETTTKTINSLFVIDPSRNNGVDHQFEEVVRNKGDRMRLDASDCECCRDYYAAVGILPSRDKGPLWRSPSTTPVKRCRQYGPAVPVEQNEEVSLPDVHQDDIETHKKTISRHRHNWARPQTPPGYWNIGFPDTQEAQEINERAKEMHQQKLKTVEREAERGRWIRR